MHAMTFWGFLVICLGTIEMTIDGIFGTERILSKLGIVYDIISASGDTTFSITSNIAWTASSDQTWCTVTFSGTGNGTITASCQENTSIFARVATITVSGKGVNDQIVTVTQAAGLNAGIINLISTAVNLYPIPVISYLMISCSIVTDQTSLVIYNSSGIEVYSSSISNSITTLDMSQYSSGVYFIKIILPDSGIITRKIIKQ